MAAVRLDPWAKAIRDRQSRVHAPLQRCTDLALADTEGSLEATHGEGVGADRLSVGTGAAAGFLFAQGDQLQQYDYILAFHICCPVSGVLGQRTSTRHSKLCQ